LFSRGGVSLFLAEINVLTALSSLWLPIILSGIALFFASWAAWMLFPHHKGDWKGLPDEEGIMAALRKFNIPPGQYNFPHACSHNEMNTEDFKGRKEAGPSGFLTVWQTWPNMGVNMLCTILFFTVSNGVIAYLAGMVIPPGANGWFVFRFVATAGILTYGTANILNGIWFNRKMVADIVDGIVYGLITGAMFAALWPGTGA
jgi:hypothetical protein